MFSSVASAVSSVSSRSPSLRRGLLSQSLNQYRSASTLILSDPLTADDDIPAATQSAVTAAKMLNSDSVDILVVGEKAPKRTPEGVSKVFYASTNIVL